MNALKPTRKRLCARIGIKNSVTVANYFAQIDSDTCTGCGVCEKRYQIKAISVEDNIATVDLEKCMGCGLCATGCPVNAAKLKLKPEDQRVDPQRFPRSRARLC